MGLKLQNSDVIFNRGRRLLEGHYFFRRKNHPYGIQLSVVEVKGERTHFDRERSSLLRNGFIESHESSERLFLIEVRPCDVLNSDGRLTETKILAVGGTAKVQAGNSQELSTPWATRVKRDQMIQEF